MTEKEWKQNKQTSLFLGKKRVEVVAGLKYLLSVFQFGIKQGFVFAKYVSNRQVQVRCRCRDKNSKPFVYICVIF